jgi:hypothetical protein
MKMMGMRALCHPPSMVVVLRERPPSPPLCCLRPRCICSVYRPQSPSLATYNRARLGLWMIILLCWGKKTSADIWLHTLATMTWHANSKATHHSGGIWSCSAPPPRSSTVPLCWISEP